MASGVRMLVAGIMVVTNTIILLLFAFAGGAVFGPVYSWLSLQKMTNPTINPAIVQWFPAVFYGFLIVLEFVLIFNLYMQTIAVRSYSPEY
jgi:hypothetical protein